MATNEYRVENDVYRTLDDGRVILVATAGTAMPLVQARGLGLLKDDLPRPGPSETKGTGESDEDGAGPSGEPGAGPTPPEALVGSERTDVDAPAGSERALPVEEAAGLVDEESEPPATTKAGIKKEFADTETGPVTAVEEEPAPKGKKGK